MKTLNENTEARLRGSEALRKKTAARWDWDMAIDGLRAILADVYGERDSLTPRSIHGSGTGGRWAE